MVKATRLQQKLRAVPAKVQMAVKPVLERHAAEVVMQMKALAPRDSGALRDSIGWTWGAAPKGSLVLGVVKGKGKLSGPHITIYAGTRDKTLGDQDAFYARWLEFGNSRMPAHPFFFPVWRANRRRVKSSVSRAIKNSLKT